MSSVVLNKAAAISAPISAAGAQDVEATADVDGVFCLATTASSVRVTLPIKWRGRWLRCQALTLDVDILFGTSSVSVTKDQVSTVSSNVATLNAATGFTIPAGTYMDFFIPKTSLVTDFAIISSGTNGFFKMYPSDDVHVGST